MALTPAQIRQRLRNQRAAAIYNVFESAGSASSFDPSNLTGIFIDVDEADMTQNPFDGATEVYDTGVTGATETAGDFEMWFKLNLDDGQPTAAETFMGMRNTGGNNVCISGVVNTSGDLVFFVGDGAGTFYRGIVNGAFADGVTGNKVIRWRHESNQMYVYIDGVLQTLDATFDGDTTGYSGYTTSNNIPLMAYYDGTTSSYIQHTAGTNGGTYAFSRILNASEISNMETFLGL